jgi:hypothetical protein
MKGVSRMKFRTIRRTVIITLALSSGLCVAQNPRNVLDIMRDDNVTQSELADVIVSREAKAKWLLPVINAPEFDDRATTKSPATLFVMDVSRAIYEVLSRMPVDSLSASDYDALQALIDFRNDLLDAGGSANVCLVGSITSSIYSMLFHIICHEGNHDIQAIEEIVIRNQVGLGNVIAALAKDDRWTTRSSSIDLGASDEEVAKQYLAQLGIDDLSDGRAAWFTALIEDKGSLVGHFSHSLLSEDAFFTYLGPFVALADNQRILQIAIEFEEETGKPVYSYFDTRGEEQKTRIGKPIELDEEQVTQLSDDIAAYLDGQPLPVSIRTFQPISADKVLGQIVNRFGLPNVRRLEYHLERNLLNYNKSELATYHNEGR